MAADITDKFSKIISGTTRPVATTLSAQKLSGATTASLTAATGWDTDTAVHGIMYRTDAGTGAKVAGSQIDWKATLSGTTLSNFTVTAGTDDTYAIGATVELAPTAAWGDDLVTGLLVSHDQDGTLKAGAVDVAAVLATDVVETAKIKDLNVTTAKIAANAVTPAKVGQAHSVRVTKSGNVSTANNAVITWDTQEWRTTTAMHDTSTNNSRLIAPIDGYYQVNFTISSLNGETGAERIFHLRVNGTTKCVNWASYNSSLFNYNSSSVTVRLLANEYVELYQTSGVSVTVRSGSSSFFDMTFLGGL